MTSIGSLRHRVKLCTQQDVVLIGTTDLKLARNEVLETWAEISNRAAVAMSPEGAALRESVSTVKNFAGTRKSASHLQTHVIRIRYRPDLNFSVLAWIYEERRKSSPRWFKILKIAQTEDGSDPFFTFDCRLMERGDNLIEPDHFSPASTMPPGVRI